MMIRTTDATDGYDLLWQIIALCVPGFNYMVQPEFPDWFDQGQDIFLFCKNCDAVLPPAEEA